jgi:hypothetical protein
VLYARRSRWRPPQHRCWWRRVPFGCQQGVLAGTAADVQYAITDRAAVGQLNKGRLGSADVPRGRARLQGVELMSTAGTHWSGQAVGAFGIAHMHVLPRRDDQHHATELPSGPPWIEHSERRGAPSCFAARSGFRVGLRGRSGRAVLDHTMARRPTSSGAHGRRQAVF